MTPVGPVPQDVVARVLQDHHRVPRERAEVVATLDRLTPAWHELQAVLNEVLSPRALTRYIKADM